MMNVTQDRIAPMNWAKEDKLMIKQPKFIGVDLFAGAGGLSLGAEMARVDVALSIEKDKNAAETYSYNHPSTKVINDDIANITKIDVSVGSSKILFGGPPCQGFSYSNQRTRSKDNPSNWLLREFLRIVDIWRPDWVIFENVRGFVNTEARLFLNSLIIDFEEKNYTCTWAILNALDFGVPQNRSRFFLVASRHGYKINFPVKASQKYVTVSQAISDLPSLENGASEDYLEYQFEATNSYAKRLRGKLSECSGHLVSRNAPHIIERYRYISPGGNWKDIPEHLMKNYTDRTRCHTGIYHRLRPDEPALTIGNYRKAMLIHPWENRGLSVREAARIQSFPDWYEFKGSIGFQQQQVGNAVPPLLAQAVFSIITGGEYSL